MKRFDAATARVPPCILCRALPAVVRTVKATTWQAIGSHRVSLRIRRALRRRQHLRSDPRPSHESEPRHIELHPKPSHVPSPPMLPAGNLIEPPDFVRPLVDNALAKADSGPRRSEMRHDSAAGREGSGELLVASRLTMAQHAKRLGQPGSEPSNPREWHVQRDERRS
jgi:hypothetical protein